MGCSSSSSSHGKVKRKTKKASGISQWVKKVKKFSSQYNSTSWGADMIAGPPNVYPNYGDKPGAWAPEDIDDKQFLEFKYDEAVYITGIDIYETYHGGGVTSIQARDDEDNWKTLWKADKATVIQTARIFSPKLDLQDFKCKTKEIRLEIDCTACGTWVEIDAVELHGSKVKRKTKKASGLSQWVKKVTKFSSQYDSTCWGAELIAGPPNVYPNYGDKPGAWAPEDIDDKQFLEFKYDDAVYITGIDIYETYHGGGVTTIQARDDEDNWKTLWKADKATVIQTARIFSPKLDLQDFKCKTKEIRLEIDCTACGTWVEIDAVELHGSKKKKEKKRKLSQWVARVTKFSSQYDTEGWSANCVAGSPNVYPDYGDNHGTWAQGDLDNKQFIEVEYNEAVKVKGIDIYETYHAGGVAAILGLSADGKWKTLWKTDRPKVITSSRIFSPELKVKDFKDATKNIRIEIDCSRSQSWVEIDAVQLHGRICQGDDSDSDSDSD